MRLHSKPFANPVEFTVLELLIYVCFLLSLFLFNFFFYVHFFLHSPFPSFSLSFDELVKEIVALSSPPPPFGIGGGNIFKNWFFPPRECAVFWYTDKLVMYGEILRVKP
jgi:hypothetical protein